MGWSTQEGQVNAMPNKSAKGSSFERQVAREISLWWSDGQADDWFWRTAGSGGRATNRAKAGKSTANSAGDIGAECPEAQKLLNIASLELKRGYQNTDVQELLDHKGKSQFRDFYKQAAASASLAGTPYWWLIVRRDRRHALILTNQPIVIVYGDSIGRFLIHDPFNPGEVWQMMPLADFLQDPAIKQFYKNEAQRFSSGSGL